MKLYEYEVKKIFDQMKIPIPKQYGVIHSPEELKTVKIQFPLMLKSMVLVGGRGKAGGIKKALTMEEARSIAQQLFSLKIKGFPVESVLLEEAVDQIDACYIGTTMDPATFHNVIIVSAFGGVDIEQVAHETPEAIIKREILDNTGMLPKKTVQDLSALLLKGLEKKTELIKKKKSRSNYHLLFQKFMRLINDLMPDSARSILSLSQQKVS